MAFIGNPGLFGTTGSPALDRFAFERIPHHTLWPQWPVHDLLLLAILVAGILVARGWLRVWLVVALIPGLIAAVVVERTYWTWLALLFLWRITTLLVPIAVTVIVAQWMPALPRVLLVGVAGVHAAIGLAGTLAPVVEDPAVAVVQQARPQGVGLIPLGAENVRLNARVPVHVDWKSPPYAGEDLQELWRRFDQVDAETFCSGDWNAQIDWVLLDGPAPPCTQGWSELARRDGYVVLQRP